MAKGKDSDVQSVTLEMTSHEVLEAAAAWFATKHGLGEPYSWRFAKAGGDRMKLELERVADVLEFKKTRKPKTAS